MSGALALCALAVSGGCSTVVFQEQSAIERPAVERDALQRAALAVYASKWPSPEGGGGLGRMFGAGGGERVSVAGAADFYVASLSGDRVDAILRDAARHLAAAEPLVAAADAAALSVRPTRTDVSAVESAIGELRSVRDVYLAALRRLEREGERADPKSVAELRGAFNAAIRDVGMAADALADAVAANRSESFARGPRSNFAGSL